MRRWAPLAALVSLLIFPAVTGTVNADDSSDKLIDASRSGDLKSVERLLKKGVDIEARDGEYQSSPLIWASYGGHLEVVELLLKKGADPNAVNKEKRTALMFAAGRGFDSLVRLLLDMGADPTLKDLDGNQAYRFAASRGGWKTAKVLKAAKKPSRLVRAAGKGNLPLVKKLLGNGTSPDIEDAGQGGRTALIAASANGHVDVVKYLLENGSTSQCRNIQRADTVDRRMQERSGESGGMPPGKGSRSE